MNCSGIFGTGVENGLFIDKKAELFSWKQEIATLVEPAIKEIKRLFRPCLDRSTDCAEALAAGEVNAHVGSVREGERLQMHGIPWKVGTIHVFCRIFNPSLGLRLRIPIEQLVEKMMKSEELVLQQASPE
ncbi:MAG: hypothetical protein V2B20_07765 [Pseudomonadota bacterium]